MPDMNAFLSRRAFGGLMGLNAGALAPGTLGLTRRRLCARDGQHPPSRVHIGVKLRDTPYTNQQTSAHL